MTSITIYGIPNCDIVKKTFTWFNKNKLAVQFHDYKKEGISKNKLDNWIGLAGIEKILNKRSTTWRELPAAEQEKAATKDGAIELMRANTSLIKRPVIEYQGKILVGYDETSLAKKLFIKQEGPFYPLNKNDSA